ncbi:MAG: hypothetical protein JWR36_2217 [Glaciihabitans sp.]|jgi:glyoxylase-like metal-dependent hydrolase (beta-lactamase superfamily II)|nr:hypothetical protein [Glaciihabitans sp.]
MHATSITQFDASEAGVVPGCERVRDNVWALPLSMPGGHIPYSILYLMRDSRGGVHVVDPGWDSDDNWQTLVETLQAIGAAVADVQSITVTHLHPDHIGMAERLRGASGAPVQLHALEQRAINGGVNRAWSTAAPEAVLSSWGVPDDRQPEILRMADRLPPQIPLTADRLLVDDQKLDIPGFDITVMRTPGHTPGHSCLRDDANRLLYTGDHVLPTMHGGLGLGGPTETNPIADYLASLELVSRYDDYEVLPGHGYRFVGVRERAGQSGEHHLNRSREVAAVIAEGGEPTIWEIASRLTWTAGWDQLNGFFLYSALAQTAMHREFVEAG